MRATRSRAALAVRRHVTWLSPLVDLTVRHVTWLSPLVDLARSQSHGAAHWTRSYPVLATPPRTCVTFSCMLAEELLSHCSLCFARTDVLVAFFHGGEKPPPPLAAASPPAEGAEGWASKSDLHRVGFQHLA